VRDGRRRERERAHNGYGEGYVAGEEKRLSRSRRAEEVKKAMPLSPNEAQTQALQAYLDKLSAKQDINK